MVSVCAYCGEIVPDEYGAWRAHTFHLLKFWWNGKTKASTSVPTIVEDE